MKRIYLNIPICVFIVILSISTILFPKTNSKSTKYNVLLISIDTLRPDRLSCYSTEHSKTPRIDSLAEKGALFTRAFAHTPTTLPSHTNILLGVTPQYHGVHDNSNFVVADEFLTLAEHLKRHGYSTAAVVGAFPLDSRFGLTQGFDVYDDNYGGKSNQEFSYVERNAETVIDRAMDWLKERENPWFLFVHCFDPHQRYNPPEPFKTQYLNHLYDGEVAYVDHALGKLFDYLDKNGLMDDTLIVFTGDHGESLGQHGEKTHGYFAYNATLWVPLIIYFPDLKPKRVDQYVCHTDIFPTVCDILGIEQPSFLHGSSLLPSLKGKKLPKRAIYFESLYPFYTRGWAPLKGFIQKNEKFIDTPIPELYDLERDFDELKNLISTNNLKRYEDNLAQLIEEQSYAKKRQVKKKIDREALERLKSLGYVSNVQTSQKTDFTEKDDLKTLFPYQNKLQEAMRAFDRGDNEASIALLKEIIAERKDLSQAYSYLATVYKEQRKLKEAIEILKDGLENNPSSYKLIEIYGIVLVEARQYDEAIEILKKGLNYIDYDPEIWNYLGVAYWSKGDFKSALDAYNRVLALDENYPIVFNNLGSLYLSQSLKTKKTGDLRRAILNFQRAIELDPDYPEAYNGLGSAYGTARDLDAAIRYWEKAVELRPDYSFPLYNLGLSYLKKGNKSIALEFFTRYKKEHYQYLSAVEKEKLNALIQECHK